MKEMMKDSGIAWIGKIPEHWEITKVKFLSSYIGSGTTPDSGIAEYYDGTNPWIQSGDLYKTSIISKTEKLVTDLAIKTFSALKIYKAPFVVIAMYGASVGNVSVSHINACVNQACCVIITHHKLNLMYLYYWLTVCKEDFDINAIGGGQPNISQQVIKNQYLLKVPLLEQRTIASFLDSACAKIDGIIADLEHQVDLLKEYKKSLITETVTKGLDKHVKLKDSGIAWIGEIPEHWEVKRLKYLGSTRNGLTYTPSDITSPDTGILVLRSSNIQNNELEFSDTVYVAMNIPTELRLQLNDILICSRNGSKNLIGKCALINKIAINATYGAFMCVFRSKHNKFIYYVFLSGLFDYYLASFSTSTVNQLTNQNLYNMVIPFTHDKTEQQAIACFLDTRCAEIDTIIKSKEKQIKQQKEYKKSLIYEYVTGKKRVKKVY